jgi:integrative and conjugative element protein (TIGR02256 family)
VSTIIPNTRVALSASILAQQVVQQQARPGASIQVWHQDVESGAVTTVRVQPEAPLWVELSGWRLLWDEGVRRRVRALRDASAPRETGGILVGYFDNKQRRIYVVDALPPPRDSVGDVTGFIRGVEGVRKHILEAERRTAGIVTYIGEWHSHPPGVSARPSSDDERLVSHLARELARDGYPALILIVGEGEERWVCREGESGL